MTHNPGTTMKTYSGDDLLNRIINDAPPGVVQPGGRITMSAYDAGDDGPGPVVQNVNESAMSADFVIVTRRPGHEINRHNNSVQIMEGPNGRGMMLDEISKTGSVLFEHGFAGWPLPIASCRNPQTKELAIKKSKNKATSTAWFSQKLELAGLVFALVAEDIVRMCSVGFFAHLGMVAKKGKDQKLPEGVEQFRSWRGWDFVETELFEWSIVGVGADRGAIKMALDTGKVGDTRVCESAKPFLQNYAADTPVTSGLLPGLRLVEQTADAPDWEWLAESVAERAADKVMARLAETEPDVETDDEPETQTTLTDGDREQLRSTQDRAEQRQHEDPPRETTPEPAGPTIAQYTQQKLGGIREKIAKARKQLPNAGRRKNA